MNTGRVTAYSFRGLLLLPPLPRARREWLDQRDPPLMNLLTALDQDIVIQKKPPSIARNVALRKAENLRALGRRRSDCLFGERDRLLGHRRERNIRKSDSYMAARRRCRVCRHLGS